MITGVFRTLLRGMIRAGEEVTRTHLAVTRMLAGIKTDSLLDVGCAVGRKAAACAWLPGDSAATLFDRPA